MPDQMEAARDAFAAMCAFLHLDHDQKFTESDRQAIKRDLSRLAQCVGDGEDGEVEQGGSPQRGEHDQPRPVDDARETKPDEEQPEREKEAHAPAAAA